MSNNMQDRTVSTLRSEGLTFGEHYVKLGDVLCRKTKDYNEKAGAGSRNNLLSTALEWSNSTFFPSGRFWLSFCAKVGISPSVFNLFTHEEVFNRCRDRNKVSESGNIRIVEEKKSKDLLAISDPSKGIIHWENAYKIVEEKKGTGVYYNEGVVSSLHRLQNDTPVRVGIEDYEPRIQVMIPIDGYGSPTVYLALVRKANNAVIVAMGKAFKSTVKVSKKKKADPIEFSLERMFDSFSNDEGFDALIRRMDAARHAPLSVREFHEIQKILSNLPRDIRAQNEIDRMIRPEVRFFNRLAGDLHLKYGLAHLQEMTEKQMGLLETDISVYEAFNFISELTTHHLDYQNNSEANVAGKLQSWIGRVLARAYDLEGTISQPKKSYLDRYL
tara:strand:- start:87623 stop:88780 length:1158 start_codon:yes stop_codon:yes gene_type:complete